MVAKHCGCEVGAVAACMCAGGKNWTVSMFRVLRDAWTSPFKRFQVMRGVATLERIKERHTIMSTAELEQQSLVGQEW